ncbi:hypothetical protein [Mucilaginibacter sp. SP1R1]|uniref:hypothetical protein n=1 Tax=Mucilaginibacter sp. SP1R1 TaxID=2723091 RepID=UPI0016160C34|nr:hypothetical protein [Mucilaginibacter sp. SP1R1]MBB6151875.1 hypothetical protein [Mucilaginibacter sp. SP1R1]
MKKNHLILICLCFLCVFNAKAQDNYQAGFAILNDGTRISGLISVYDTDPWFNQRFIYLKDSAAVAADPTKNVNAKKYTADELKYYKIGERTFTKIHYVDAENLQLKSLGSNDHLLEVLALGRINTYRFYPYPQDAFASLVSEEDVRQQIKRDHDNKLKSWKMLAQKGDDAKYRNVFDYDLQKYFEDTPEVLEKYQKGGYGNESISAKKGLAARMMSMAKKATYMPIQWESIVAAIKDYNQKNSAAK